jgi:hypothetical protein
MTADRAVAGDFLRAASHHLQFARARDPHGPGEVAPAAASLGRLAVALGRHLHDAAPAADLSAYATGDPALRPSADRSRSARQLTGRPRAAADALRALARAAHRLDPPEAPAGAGKPAAPAGWPVAGHLAAAAQAVTGARDLLQTHFAPGPAGGATWTSEWAPVVTSDPVRRALFAEVAGSAHLAASAAARVGQAGLARRRGARRAAGLLEACQDFWAAEAAIRAALLTDPVQATERELLHAIPVNALPARAEPSGTETVPQLCGAVISTAERVRQATWRQAGDGQRLPPGASAASLRQCAAAATVTSYAYGVVIDRLADRAGALGMDRAGQALATAGAAAPAANSGWIAASRALGQMKTDTRGTLTAAAAEAVSLARWTGRLAYADPRWEPLRSRCADLRRPEDLAAHPGEVAGVAAAVHHASAAVSRLALTEAAQANTISAAGRMYAPARAVAEPDALRAEVQAHVRQLLAGEATAEQVAAQAGVSVSTIRRLARNDNSHYLWHDTAERILALSPGRHGPPPALRYVPAAPGQLEALRDAYQAAGDGSEQLAAGMDTAAPACGSPSRVLAVARLVAGGHPAPAPAAGPQPDTAAVPEASGPVMLLLQQMGVHNPDLLARASELDQAAELAAPLGAAGMSGRGMPAADADGPASATRRSGDQAPAADDTRAVMEQATAEILRRIRETGRPAHPGEPQPWDINRGRCVDWAELVCDRIPGAEMDERDDPHSGMLHTFVVLGGRCYDAECLDGVNDAAGLPCFSHPWARTADGGRGDGRSAHRAGTRPGQHDQAPDAGQPQPLSPAQHAREAPLRARTDLTWPERQLG